MLRYITLHVHLDIVCVLFIFNVLSFLVFFLLFGKTFPHSENRKCTILYLSCSVNQLLLPSEIKTKLIILIF